LTVLSGRSERRLIAVLAVTAALLGSSLFFLERRDAVRVEVVPPPAAEVPAS
jgi:hypothetical protein